jgi:hypothetical protein
MAAFLFGEMPDCNAGRRPHLSRMKTRKKWERDWDQVKYCSERCRRAAKSPA